MNKFPKSYTGQWFKNVSSFISPRIPSHSPFQVRHVDTFFHTCSFYNGHIDILTKAEVDLCVPIKCFEVDGRSIFLET